MRVLRIKYADRIRFHFEVEVVYFLASERTLEHVVLGDCLPKFADGAQQPPPRRTQRHGERERTAPFFFRKIHKFSESTAFIAAHQLPGIMNNAN